MKIILLALVAVLLSTSRLSAQAGVTKIGMEEGFPRYKFKYDALDIGIKEVATILENNEQAYQLIRPAKRNAAVGNSILYMGVAMAIVPLGEVFKSGGSRRYWEVYGIFAGIGVGMVGASLPFLNKANKQAEHAIDVYNAGLSGYNHKKEKPAIYLGATGTGVGLSMAF
ncbi:hypothetical protein MKJ04_15045 [Pontibacter sp. E15-1]|uniref:hypothetical protein n=1 Tax=Pontibacter sp. E15-1 TaxID=2919918 RepID=UPI001F4FC649|nr:hypothetical protein [Pontibacter sp. E15-1]MCJ8166162.1 hypothetical protein [Pontibacter sp. E15-1]